jgi:hypothetical protein
MSDNKVKRINMKELPWYYKLVLKIPGTDFLENAGGIFWGVITPTFLILEFFLSIFLMISSPFPINLVLTSIIPISTFMIFLKITLDRFINWWNAIFGNSGFVWNVDKTLQEYVNLLKKQEEEKNSNKH